MEVKDALGASVLKYLEGSYNYVDWSIQVQTYLVAKDLWDTIEATAKPPKQEDDEIAFKAWSDKNSMALRVIKNSCWPNTFSEIGEISFAKVAWNTLAEKYLPKVVLQLIGKDNYMEWSVQVEHHLMAHDLWDIVEATTEPPNQEDGDAAFHAWRNSMALHVIQNSCNLDTLFEIRDISSAKVAWNTLAEKYLAENTSSDVIQVLDEYNYADWSVQVEDYLTAHDLWDIIEETKIPSRKKDDEVAFEAWSKKNCTALHVIQISCGTNAFSRIKKISTAKIAWNTLAEWNQINVDREAFENVAQNWTQINVDHEAFKKDFVQVVRSGDWNAVEEFLRRHPGSAGLKITEAGDTALHIAVQALDEHMVEKLVAIMSEQELEVRNNKGDTALVCAIYNHDYQMGDTHTALTGAFDIRAYQMGDTHTALTGAFDIRAYRMAECMLRKNRNLVSIKSSSHELPVVTALLYGYENLARYLYSVTPVEDLKPENGWSGARLCTLAIDNRTLDIALHLIVHCPSLALARDKYDRSPLYALVSRPFAFPSENRLVFWKRWIYKCIRVRVTPAIKDFRLNINQTVNRRQSIPIKILESVLSLLRQLVVKLLKVFGIKDLYDMKVIHVQANVLLASMCNQFVDSNSNQWEDSNGSDAIFYAIENGILKFVDKMAYGLKSLLVRSRSDDERFSNALWAAIFHRQAEIFSLICGVRGSKDLAYGHDKQGNNILHMAGKLPPSTLINRTAGAAFQMQRELQWYKAVESIACPYHKEEKNKDGKTPRELFTESHMELVKEGEKWMKSTATSCTVVGALIVTIMFAAVFTVPGGNNQNTGYPMFLKDKQFILFIISDSISLFSSSTSVLMFLGILTSRYLEEDFLKSLPSKMIIGLSTLFFSIATMMIAFSAALLIMLRELSWIFIPAICLASVPVTLFVLLQFPLLVEMAISTFGSGVVKRKRKMMMYSEICIDVWMSVLYRCLFCA